MIIYHKRGFLHKRYNEQAGNFVGAGTLLYSLSLRVCGPPHDVERVSLPTMAAWMPNQAGLQDILQTIHKSTDTNTSGVQSQVTHVRR